MYNKAQMQELDQFLLGHPEFELVKKPVMYNPQEKNHDLFIKFAAGTGETGITQLLDFLWLNRFELTFHDPFYPSGSDPGAYFSYSFLKSPGIDRWSMTLGNHGWSGGIYHISKTVLAKQLHHLLQKSLSGGIQVHRVAFFDHYSVKPEAENIAMNNEISEIHNK